MDLFPRVNTRYGAPMGRMGNNDHIGDRNRRELELQKIVWTDGAYDQGGAYWGHGEPVWAAYCPQEQDPDDEFVLMYFRAADRDHAKSVVQAKFPLARFSEIEYPVETVLYAYIEAALWSSCNEDAEPLDDEYGPEDIDQETVAEMRSDVREFLNDVDSLLQQAKLEPDQVGHDFWLTRNGHGAGFWDRGLGEVGDRLTDAAQAFGGVDLMPCEDGTLAT